MHLSGTRVDGCYENSNKTTAMRNGSLCSTSHLAFIKLTFPVGEKAFKSVKTLVLIFPLQTAVAAAVLKIASCEKESVTFHLMLDLFLEIVAMEKVKV